MKRILSGDLLAALLTVAIITYISLTVYGSSGDEAIVHIEVGQKEWIYDLQQDQDAYIPGPLGDTHVVIEDGHVHVESSPCKAKICIAAGEIAQVNDWIICLPNRVFITIEGEAELSDEVDEVVF
ncbi:MAG: NusG domain II-containing protein [Spirochaetota bacterium]